MGYLFQNNFLRCPVSKWQSHCWLDHRSSDLVIIRPSSVLPSIRINSKHSFFFQKIPYFINNILILFKFQLKQNLATRADTYDCEDSLFDNLQRILGVDFPGPLTSCDASENIAEESAECGICYNYHLVSFILKVWSFQILLASCENYRKTLLQWRSEI